MEITSPIVVQLRRLSANTVSLPGAPDGNAQFSTAAGHILERPRMNGRTWRALLRHGFVEVQPTTRIDGLTTVAVTDAGRTLIASATLPPVRAAVLRLVEAGSVSLVPDAAKPSVWAWRVDGTGRSVHDQVWWLAEFGFVEIPERVAGCRPVVTASGQAMLKQDGGAAALAYYDYSEEGA